MTSRRRRSAAFAGAGAAMGSPGDHEGLTADFEHALDRKSGRVVRAPDERRIVHMEQADRALFAEPVGLARWRSRGQDLRRVTDGRTVRAELKHLRDRTPDARVAHRRPANRDTRSHDRRVAQLQGLAGHDLRVRYGRLDLEAETGLDDPLQLRAFVANERVLG